MFRQFRFRLYPSRSQRRRMEDILDVSARFYNLLLAQRMQARQAGHSLGWYEQAREVKVFRDSDEAAARVHSHVLQNVVADVNRAWRRWLGHGAKGIGPRWKQPGRVNSFGFKQAKNGWKLDGRRLRIFGVGRVAVRWHRQLQGVPKVLRIVRHAGGRWYANIMCDSGPDVLPPTGEAVGIDLGVTRLATLSTGEHIENPRWFLAAKDQIDDMKARIDRAAEGSNRQLKLKDQLKRLHERVAARRRDFISKAVAGIVRRFDYIGIEDLDVVRLIRDRPSVEDAGLGLFRRLLVSKAEACGRVVVLVPPENTSTDCCVCGQRQEMELGERVFRCGRCGSVLDRDVNAARNVLARARRQRAS
jgi:putative transposase